MRDMFRILDKEKRGEVNTDELRSSLLFDAFLSYFLVSLRFFICFESVCSAHLTLLERAGIAFLSVCPSARPSFKRVHCDKTKNNIG